MTSSAYSDRPPTYEQALRISQEELQKNYSQHYPPVSIAPVVYTNTIKFSDQPVTINCPYCGQLITTVVEEENGPIVYLLCIFLALICLFMGCCLIPFCISNLKDKIHYCPRCQRPIGKKTLS